MQLISAPDIEQQLKEVEKYLNTKVGETEVGTNWVVIPAKWLKVWKSYVGWDGVTASNVKPSALNTQSLLKEKMVFRESDAELKRGLTIGTDIEIVLEEAYQLFVEWYGKDTWHQLLRRKVITITDKEKNDEKIVELWAPKFEINICGRDGEPRAKKNHLVMSRNAKTLELMKDAVDAAYTLKESEKYRVWYSRDSDIWVLLGSIEEPADNLAETIGALPGLAKAPKPGVMVEVESGGKWLRSQEDMVQVVEDIKERLLAVNKMSNEEWRSSLVVGDLCDYNDVSNPDITTWRETQIVEVTDTKLTIQWRGFPHTLEVEKSDDHIAKPYSQARDWRNQLRSNTKVEVHLDAVALSEGEDPANVAPVYKNGPFYFYYSVSEKEWWIGDEVRITIGYINADCEQGDPEKIDADRWQFYEPSTRQWGNDPEINVTVLTPPTHDKWPEQISITGHVGSQKEKMGNWTRTRYILADVQRIDRKQGKLAVNIPVRRNNNNNLQNKGESIKGILLHGDQVCEAGTHLTLQKRKSGPVNVQVTKPEENTKGLAGLRNLGNTCYMNSMLQCLNATGSLARHLMSDKYKSEVNTKNILGTGGVLAESYAGLVQEMWAGQYSVVVPTDFKESLGRFAPQFQGYQQQDSMELFTFLLDNLHEDLNRIKEKPYVEDTEDEAEPDEELAAIAWSKYKLRNDSVVVDELMGQFKSHLTCPCCQFETRKFEVYMSILLPLPQMPKTLKVLVVFMDVTKQAVKVEVQVKKKETVKALAQAIATKLEGQGLSTQNLLVLEWHNEKVYKTLYSPKFSNFQTVDGITEHDEVIAYEIAEQRELESTKDDGDDSSDDDRSFSTIRRFKSQPMRRGLVAGEGFSGLLVQVALAKAKSWGKGYSYTTHSNLYKPRLMCWPTTATCKDIHNAIHNWMEPTILGDVLTQTIWDKHKLSPKTTTTTANNNNNNNNNGNTNNNNGNNSNINGNNNGGGGGGSSNYTDGTTVIVSDPIDNVVSDAAPPAYHMVTQPGEPDEVRERDVIQLPSASDVNTQSASDVNTPSDGSSPPPPFRSTPPISPRTSPITTMTGHVGDQSNLGGVFSGYDDEGVAGDVDEPEDDEPNNEPQPEPTEMQDMNVDDDDDDDKLKQTAAWLKQQNPEEAAVEEEAEPLPVSPYAVALTTDSVMREDKYDTNSPIVYLPYTDQPYSELIAEHQTQYQTLSLTVIVEDKAIDEPKLFPIKAPSVDSGLDNKTLQIEKCLAAFSAREQLNKMNTWYCSRCKDHVQAFKKMDVWSVPKVLTLHLKRFQYDSGYAREKIDSLVKFHEYLDMTPHVQGPQNQKPLKYRLFAVSNHIGMGISSGHYTAYARHNEKWKLFNDSRVDDATINDVCSQEAYVLFYELCDGEEETNTTDNNTNDDNNNDDDDNNTDYHVNDNTNSSNSNNNNNDNTNNTANINNNTDNSMNTDNIANDNDNDLVEVD